MQKSQTAAIGFFLSLTFLIPIQAHNLEAEVQVEKIDFEVRAFYEDGTPAGNASTEVLTSDGVSIATGTTNEEGRYTFSNDLKNKLEVVLEDETGHRETFPLSAAAIAMAIRGEAAELDHTHSEGGHQHGDNPDEEGEQDPGEGEGAHSHGDGHDHDADHEEGIVLAKGQRGSQANQIISGLGYVLGITGILFYFLGFKQKAGA